MASAPTRRRLSPSERRALLLQAALEVFAAEGYDRASMDGIAAAAAISKPVLYDHFDSKQALYIAVLEQQVQTLSSHVIPRAKPAEGSLEERLRDSAFAALSFARQHPDAWRLLFQEPLGDREIARAFHLMRDQATNAVAAVIAQNRLKPPATDEPPNATHALAMMLMAALERLGILALEQPSVELRALVDIYLGLVWLGIRQLAADD
jgi:AcrR family transcriptional regulator